MANRYPKNDSPVRFSAAVLPLTAVCRGHLISLICFIHDAMRRPTWIVCKRAGAQGVSVPGCPIPLTSSAAPRAASLAPWLAASVAWLAALSAASLAVSSAASLAAWSAASGRLGCLVGRLVGCLVGYLVGCLVGCLVGRLVGPPRRVPRPLEPPLQCWRSKCAVPWCRPAAMPRIAWTGLRRQRPRLTRRLTVAAMRRPRQGCSTPILKRGGRGGRARGACEARCRRR